MDAREHCKIILKMGTVLFSAADSEILTKIKLTLGRANELYAYVVVLMQHPRLKN
jgi:hypothetical protein